MQQANIPKRRLAPSWGQFHYCYQGLFGSHAVLSGRGKAMFTLESLNLLPVSGFVDALGDVFEHAPWVAEAAAAKRPYPTVAALHEGMLDAVRNSPPERQLAFIQAHPELGSKIRRADLAV